MITEPLQNADQIIALAGIHDEDLSEVRALLHGSPHEAVRQTLQELRARLGLFAAPELVIKQDELVWLEALLRFLPEQVQWYRAQGIPEDVVNATVADIGRHVAISRATKGYFSLDTWKWLTEHATGTLYQLGRLQFQLIAGPASIPGIEPGEAILGVHIPQKGPILPQAVTDSIEQAIDFFGTYFAQHPVRFANCISWLLDPYLTAHLAPDSNISRFANRFTPYASPVDSPRDAVYFTFRTRDLSNLAELPRNTALQKLVLERIDAGGSWQVGQGYFSLLAQGAS